MLLGGACVLITGCVVTSVYPFYTEADLTFDPALLGTFGKPGASTNDLWIFERDKKDVYRLTTHEGDKTRATQARLFKLGGQLFLDCCATQTAEDIEPEPVPTHLVMRVQQVTPTLKLSIMKNDWLKELLDKQPKAVRHIVTRTGEGLGDQRIVLTADTAELQQFLLKHVNTKEAWTEDDEGLTRVTPQTTSK